MIMMMWIIRITIIIIANVYVERPNVPFAQDHPIHAYNLRIITEYLLTLLSCPGLCPVFRVSATCHALLTELHIHILLPPQFDHRQLLQ